MIAGRKLLHTSGDSLPLPTRWKCRDGKEIKIVDMEDRHLQNTHRMLVLKVAPLQNRIMNYHTGDMRLVKAENTITAFEMEMKRRKIKPLVTLCGCCGGYEVPLDYRGEALDYLVGEKCDECGGNGYKKGGNR